MWIANLKQLPKAQTLYHGNHSRSEDADGDTDSPAGSQSTARYVRMARHPPTPNFGFQYVSGLFQLVQQACAVEDSNRISTLQVWCTDHMPSQLARSKARWRNNGNSGGFVPKCTCHPALEGIHHRSGPPAGRTAVYVLPVAHSKSLSARGAAKANAGGNGAEADVGVAPRCQKDRDNIVA